jgi:hypothetical protein
MDRAPRERMNPADAKARLRAAAASADVGPWLTRHRYAAGATSLCAGFITALPPHVRDPLVRRLWGLAGHALGWILDSRRTAHTLARGRQPPTYL